MTIEQRHGVNGMSHHAAGDWMDVTLSGLRVCPAIDMERTISAGTKWCLSLVIYITIELFQFYMKFHLPSSL